MSGIKLHDSYHDMPPSNCPKCGHLCTSSAAVGGDDAKPVPGDLSICIKCAGLALYGDDLMLREPDAMELLEFQLSDEWQAIQQSQAAIRKINQQMKHQ